MNPFVVNRIIKESKREGKNISTSDLSKLCDCRISHSFLKISDETFISDSGRPRHIVTGLCLHAWLRLWFYNPPKFSKIHGDLSSLEKSFTLSKSSTEDTNKLGE